MTAGMTADEALDVLRDLVVNPHLWVGSNMQHEAVAVLAREHERLRGLERSMIFAGEQWEAAERDLAVARQELDEKDTECADWYSKAIAAQTERDAARQENERLTEALRELIHWLRSGRGMIDRAVVAQKIVDVLGGEEPARTEGER